MPLAATAQARHPKATARRVITAVTAGDTDVLLVHSRPAITLPAVHHGQTATQANIFRDTDQAPTTVSATTARRAPTLLATIGEDAARGRRALQATTSAQHPRTRATGAAGWLCGLQE